MSQRNNSGCLTLFALPFAGVGVGVAVWMGGMLLTWSRAQSWVETPATIVKAELAESHDSDGGTTYQATAEYLYTFDGKRYHSTRVGLSGGKDNVGSYQQDMHRRLSECQRTGAPIPCYVNPADPTESLIDRDIRIGMLIFQSVFVLAFGGAGFGLFFFGLASLRADRRRKSLSTAAPDKPWLCREDWAAGLVQPRGQWKTTAIVAVATGWNAVCLPLWLLLPGEVFVKGNNGAAFGFLFLAVGVGLCLLAARSIARRRRYGAALFEMAFVPGVVGGQLAGVVRIPARLEPEGGFHAALRCFRSHVVHTSDGHSTSEELVWESEQAIARTLGPAAETLTAVPIQFAIPFACRPSDVEQGDNTFAWRVEVWTDAAAYRAEFEVPVFRTEQSRPDATDDTAPVSEYAAPIASAERLAHSGVALADSPEGEGIRLIFARGRHPGVIGFLVVFAIIWTGVIVLMASAGVPLLFPIVFSLADVLIVYLLIDLLFFRSVVDASPRGLRVAAGYFSLGEGQWIDAADVENVEITPGMSSNNVQFYDLKVRCRNGRRVTLGKRIRGRLTAEATLAEVEKAIGKS